MSRLLTLYENVAVKKGTYNIDYYYYKVGRVVFSIMIISRSAR
jgi:hypothetical protein